MSHLRKDIALLQLDGEVQLSDKVNTVCLPLKGSRIPPGTECFITGKFAYGLEKIIFCGNCICQLYFCEFSIYTNDNIFLVFFYEERQTLIFLIESKRFASIPFS